MWKSPRLALFSNKLVFKKVCEFPLEPKRNLSLSLIRFLVVPFYITFRLNSSQ